MAKYSWSEVFTSIEGEGPWSGRPTVYIRFTGCNFECRGFNNPENLDTTSVEALGFDPTDYININEIPLITKGCDSIYSWDSKFKHMWYTGSENELAAVVMSYVPHHSWDHPKTQQPVILSLTGGEPTLRFKTLPLLLNHPLFEDLKYILIETNCSVPLSENFLEELNKWMRKTDGTIIWSNSPKLSVSGEKWEVAIRPDVALQQVKYRNVRDLHIEQYFKFVCGPDDADFDEVEKAMKEYYDAGIYVGANVYIMPVSCLEEQQQQIAAQVAEKCIQRGYTYCHRTHISIWGNKIGT
jgi:organic radical activating enzyme